MLRVWLKHSILIIKSLEELSIGDYALCDDSIQYLAHALRVNQALKKLNLTTGSLTSLSTEGLAEALTNNKHLEVLDISGNPLHDDGIQHLAHALQVNHRLKELYLDSCGITDVGLKYFVKSIQENKGLNTLSVTNSVVDLAANHGKRSNCYSVITEKIIPVLTECLQNNSTLTYLELSRALEELETDIDEAVNEERGVPLLTINFNLDEEV